MKKPKVLYLTFDVEYINPTRQLLKKALQEACEISLFGPGHLNEEEVNRGPEVFFETHGPFDLVMGDEYSLLRPGAIPEEKKHLHQFYFHACRFDPLFIHKGTEYYTFLRKHKGPRIITLLQSDYYNFSEDMVNMLQEIGDYFVCWGAEFILAKEKLIQNRIAGHGQDKAIYSKWNDRFLNFAKDREERILSTPHFLDHREFCDLTLERRRGAWSVLGADYQSRLTAKKLLDEAGICRSGNYLPYIFSTARKAHFHLYNKFWAIRMINGLFRRALRTSRYSFTCGSLLRYPIRKFFEIPAAGCVLVTDGCNGFEALGFQDRKNAVVCRPEDILETHQWLSRDPDRAQAIATKGRELVKGAHSVSARGRQLGESFKRIIAGRFSGTHWSGGQLCFRESSRIQTHDRDRTSTVIRG